MSPPADGHRPLLEAMPLAVYVSALDRTSGTLYVSPAIADLVGYEPEEWYRDPPLFDRVVHPADRTRVLARIAAAKSAGTPYEAEYRMIRRDGTVIWVDDRAVTVRDERGEPLHWQGYVVDVTRRKEAERRTRAQNERLREIDRMKDEFIALVSHELRTPLTSIRGYLELLLDDPELGIADPQQRSFLAVIARNSTRLQRLVEDLLLAAQAGADRLHLDTEPIDLARLAADCVEASAPVAAARGIDLRCAVAGETVVIGDQGRLGQVVDNLLSNALKFTPAGGTVEVRVRTEGGDAVLEVSDSGMGIPAAEQSRLFSRFFRTRRAQREAISGAGLGLSIAKALVEAHEGHISFTSAEGAGTTFAVRLPLAAAGARSPAAA